MRKVQACPELKIQACPDRQIVSLYIDDELPSPWKEKFEDHLASCNDCKAQFENYKELRIVLTEIPDTLVSENDAMQKAQERVWAKFPETGWQPNKTVTAWRRKVVIPFPAAAAAAAIFVLVSMLAIRGLSGPDSPITAEPQISGITADLEGVVLVDMAGILQYLFSQDGGDYMLMELPETRNFSSYGDPALVRAADYTGRSGTSP